MKILVDNYNNEFTLKVECKKTYDEYGFTYGDDNDYCNSVLEVSEEDVRVHSWSKGWPDNISGDSYVIMCPLCGAWIEIPEDKLPKRVKENAIPISRRGGI